MRNLTLNIKTKDLLILAIMAGISNYFNNVLLTFGLLLIFIGYILYNWDKLFKNKTNRPVIMIKYEQMINKDE